MPITPNIINQYQLALSPIAPEHIATIKVRKKTTIFVATPIALNNYQTNQMLYTNQPYNIHAFAHNAWIEPPTEMLLPIMIEYLQNYFAIITVPSISANADYTLETQLITLQQNFLTKPSRIELIVKITLIKMNNNNVLATRIIRKIVPCAHDTPYGGVLAANIATKGFLKELLQFIRSKQDVN